MVCYNLIANKGGNMANIKSQKKRALTNAKKNLQNASDKSRLKTAIKAVLKAVEAKDKEEAIKAYNNCSSLLDKAVSKHLKHKNYASRQKARLSKLVNSL